MTILKFLIQVLGNITGLLICYGLYKLFNYCKEKFQNKK